MLSNSLLRAHSGLAPLLATALAITAPAGAVELPDLSLDTFKTRTPEVGFDVPQRLVCRDVTTDAFLAERPGERLVEIVAPVTLLLYHGEARRVQDVVVEIDGASAGLAVYDYAPRTELVAEHAQPIEVKKTESVDKTIGGSLGGKIAGDVALAPTISGGATKSEAVTTTQNRLPPKRPLVVSGTTGRRTGVYYKLRKSSQSTLEGEQEFRVTFAAPADWSGGSIEVRCVARGEQKWLLVEQRRVWNETAKPVELRLVSHTVAKPAIEEAEVAELVELGSDPSGGRPTQFAPACEKLPTQSPTPCSALRCLNP
ncbi:hypothetical protein [Botrimarina sp.]|uniref:hypothetical protein n=1 Tax=Botrimarina sp. TaxID=2795802 RepID=UPI0032EF6602